MDWRAVLSRPSATNPDSSALDDRLDALRADLTARLRAVCASMPATEFAALVETMAHRALRWSAFPDTDFEVPGAGAQSSR